MYANYYQNTIRDHQTGLKLVLGPTGLGKTRGIVETVKELHHPDRPEAPPRCIYLTHRHQLLIELETMLQEQPNPVPLTYLKSDGDILTELAKDGKLVPALLALEKLGVFEQMPGRYSSDQFEIWQRRLQLRWQELRPNRRDEQARKDLSDEQRRVTKLLQAPFRSMAAKDPALLETWLKRPATWTFFPYVRFLHDPERPVLLATIQKSLMGFFNGKTTGRLQNIKDCIVFLDELDFLEPDMLKSLAQEAQLRNPLEFVATFLQNSPLLSDDIWRPQPELQAEQAGLCETILEESTDLGFAFPELRRFALPNPPSSRTAHLSLFRAGRTIPTTPFALEPARQRLLVRTGSREGIAPWHFVNWLAKSVHGILALMNQAAELPGLFDSLLRELWNCKNDNVAGEIERYIRANHAYCSLVHYADALESDFAYQNGYTLFSLESNLPLDPCLVDLSQIELSSTPEMQIVNLARRNLVFGLSATADFPRLVRCLNLGWIEKELGAQWLPVQEQDIALIEATQAQKDAIKYPQGRPEIVLFDLDTAPAASKAQTSLNRLLEDLHRLGYFNQPEKANDPGAVFRQQRSRIFFNTLSQIALHSQTTTHLLFMDSFKREKQLLWLEGTQPQQLSPLITALFAPEHQSDRIMRLDWLGKQFQLVFLDADQARELHASDLEKAAYDQAFMNPAADFTLVITQYATASNGVNLRCLNKAGSEIDFEAIHLLEKRHFSLEIPVPKDPEAWIKRKMLFWYGWKLYYGREINEDHFLRILREEGFGQLNQDYTRCDEYPLNLLALFYQALGRVDRKWLPAPRLEVGLSGQILKLWRNFLENPLYERWAHDPERQRHTATVILALQEQIRRKLNLESFRSALYETEDITAANRRSREIIATLLEAIEALKAGAYTPEQARELRQAWHFVRKQVLRQNVLEQFSFRALELEPIRMRELAIQTRWLLAGKLLWVSDPALHPEHRHLICERPSLAEWQRQRQLDSPYHLIANHPFLRRTFLPKGYALAYQPQPYALQWVWTPYIEQAILRGAIGEVALRSLLAHEGLLLQPEQEIPDACFEVYDARLKNAPWYLDFKNFGLSTLEKFALEPRDPAFEPDYDPAAQLAKIRQKLKAIRRRDPEARFALINLAAPLDRAMDCFDLSGKPVRELSQAEIVFIPGVVDADDPCQWHPAFRAWQALLPDPN